MSSLVATNPHAFFSKQGQSVSSSPCNVAMSHPMVYRERIAMGPVHKDKVSEWIWVGWCRCEASECQMRKKAFGEPHSRCSVCQKFVKHLGQRSPTGGKLQGVTRPFSSLEEALASFKKDLESTKGVAKAMVRKSRVAICHKPG